MRYVMLGGPISMAIFMYGSYKIIELLINAGVFQ